MHTFPYQHRGESRMVSRMVGALILSVLLFPIQGWSQTTAGDILNRTGVGRGLCVYLGDDAPRRSLTLHNNQQMLVHVLTTSDSAAAALREAARDVYGLVTAEAPVDGKSRPM